MSTLNRYRIYCTTETVYTYVWDESTPTVCPNNNGHSIDSSLTTIIDTITSQGNTNINGELSVNAGEKNMFGELQINQTAPIFQTYFLYGILNTQLTTCFCSNGGTSSPNINGCELDVSIQNDLYSYSVIRCLKVIKYRPGVSTVIRVNMIFDTPIANSLQFGGVGNGNSDLYFCYNGTEFGTRISTDGKSEIRILTITNDESSNNKTGTVTLNGTEFTVDLDDANGDLNYTTSQIAYGTTYDGWNVEAIGTTIIFQSRHVGPNTNTFSFTSNGNATGTFSQKTQGTSLSTSFTNRTNWNGSSSMVSVLDPLKRNMYAIEYSWYGSGNVLFKVYNPDTSIYETVHTLSFANTSTTPSLTSPNMYLQQGVASLGSTTPITIIISGSYAGYLGQKILYTPTHSFSNLISIPKKTEVVLSTLKNRNTYNGFSNQSEIIVKRISIITHGSKPVIIRIYKNPETISLLETDDYLNYNYINETNSIGLVSYSSNTFTNGLLLESIYIPKEDQVYIDFTDKLYLYQNECFIITAESENINEINFSVTYTDDY
ncbi:hypothetical protein SAGO17_0007 [Mimivirus AB-566-O17]|uniref:Uncharacterized protein n=1 Tax=Mimivirus AB-566-O17 TaxID=1988039 RepID=A0A1X9VNN2_9VIRU|nr:hypothetical protein SAGO17_0007 [Mimivirus AB-566-O17]